MREPVAVRFRGEQRADQVIAELCAPFLQQRRHVFGLLHDGLLDLPGLVLKRADVELPLHPTAAILSEGYGLAMAETNSHEPAGATSSHSRCRKVRITGRQRLTARGVKALEHDVGDRRPGQPTR